MSAYHYWLPEHKTLIANYTRDGFVSANLYRLLLNASFAFKVVGSEQNRIMLACTKNRMMSTDNIPFVRWVQLHCPSTKIFSEHDVIPDDYPELRDAKMTHPHMVITDEQDIVMFKLMMSEYRHDPA